MKRMFFPQLFVGVVFIALFGGCSEGDSANGNGLSVPASTPLEAYNSLISAASSGDFGVMYDLMDSGAKANWQIFVEVSRAQVDRLDSAEQAKWRSLEGVKDMRDIFYRYASMTPAMWDHYVGGFQLLRVDTVVSIVVMERDGQASVEYFRWENGAYRKTRSPEAYARPSVERVAPQAPPTAPPNSSTVPDANKR
ncbi:MAG: hypothetical protein AB7H80_18480 [Candidatus Kapaibacterium sp.]